MILKKKCADFDFVYQFSELATEFAYQLLTTTEKLQNFYFSPIQVNWIL